MGLENLPANLKVIDFIDFSSALDKEFERDTFTINKILKMAEKCLPDPKEINWLLK